LQANKLSAAIQRVTQLQLQGAANFANDMNRISEAGGNRLSEADRRKSADEQLKIFQEATGTKGTGEGGALKVGDFESRFNALDADRKKLEQQQADQAQSGDTEGLAQTTKELGELNAQSNTTRQALEFLANDTTRLDAAMNSLAERTKQLEAQQQSYMSALTDPEQLGKSLANFAAVAAGQGDRQQVGEALQFVESQRASLGEEEYQRRRRQVLEGGVASGAISQTEADNLAKSQNREDDADYQTRKQLAMDEANVRKQANEALQRLEQQGVKTLEQSMIDLAQTINEKLIALIESAEGRSQDTREKERYVREGAPPVTDINTRKEIENPFRDPLAPIPGVTDGAYGQDFTQTPATPVGAPTPPVGTTAAAGAAAGGSVAASVPIDTSALPDGISLDTNVNLVASIPNMEGLQAQIVSTTVGQVSQLINEATNGQINLRPASVDSRMDDFFEGKEILPTA